MVAAEPLNTVKVGELDPYAFFAFLGKRVVHPGGRRATEELFELGRLEPGLKVLDIGCGVATTAIELQGRFQAEVTAAGLTDLQIRTGPFEMMTPRAFLDDEGLANSLRVISTAVSRPAYFRRMAWLMPRIARAVPFLGYVVVAGAKPAATPAREAADG